MRWYLLLFLILPVQCYPDWFHQYKQRHRKLYSSEIEDRVFSILEPKYHFSKQHGYNLTYRSDINTTTNPFKNRKSERIDTIGHHRLGLPLTMDWRTHGAVTPVKKQGLCGACFSFAATGSIEYWYWKKSGDLKEFSIQQWVDCTKPDNYGCDGGLMEYVYKKAMRTPAGPEIFDPFKDKETKCIRRITRPWLKVKTYSTQSDEWHAPIEEKLAHNIVQYGPIPVGIDSASWHMEMYRGGVLKASQCGKDIDHAVLVVGFTPDYWIIRNSWGKDWGDDGYLYLERWRNACGINSYASFITEASI